MKRLLVVLLLSLGCHAAVRPPVDEWQRARAVADQYVGDGKYGYLLPALTAEPRRTTPYLFVYRPSRISVVVRDGRAITARGLSALQRYLEAGDLLERRVATAADLAYLLLALEVTPPGTERFILPGGLDPQLDPTVAYRGDHAELSVFAVQPSEPMIPDVNGYRIGEYYDVWTLTLARGRAPTWRNQPLFIRRR